MVEEQSLTVGTRLSAAAASAAYPGSYRPFLSVLDLSTGTVGPPLRCCEIMLREWKDGGYSPRDKIPQGEILIHGAHVSSGYYKNEEQTREAFIDIDGKRWFATGDVGEFLDNGSLRIIGIPPSPSSCSWLHDRSVLRHCCRFQTARKTS